MVFDRVGNYVRHFYICSKCDDIMHVDYDAQGNAPLRRHLCFKEHLKEHPVPPESNRKAAEKEQKIFLSSRFNPKEKKLMSQVFTAFTKLCIEAQPDEDYKELEEAFLELVPENFEFDNW